jgi:predicted XRE-type DNA-binding protein
MVDVHVDRHRNAHLARQALGGVAQRFLRQAGVSDQIIATLEVASPRISQLDPAR